MSGLTNAQLAEIRQLNSFVMSRDRWGAFYEHLTYLLYYSTLRPNDVAVDCGVNVGDHCRLMAHLCYPGTVFGFEAAPEMLSRAKAANADLDNIRYFENAVWEHGGGTKTFHYFPHEHGLSGFNFRPGVTGELVFDVQTVTLDEAVEGDPGLIKLDIEGAEYHALKGAERLMTFSKPIIVFENSRGDSAAKFGYTKDNFFELFYERGYEIYSIAGAPFVPEIWDDVGCPWQFIAAHPTSSRAKRALGMINAFVASMR